ncbi:MAG: bacteriohemerythrin [Treponema sp.]|nr:bacteriohemerythrin [Treponema sp.]
MNDEKSELIALSGAFSCGVKVIDDQYKELINMINEMYSHLAGPEETQQEYLLNIIHDTVRHFKTHFAAEEKIMIATRFHNFIAHKKVHDSFILTIVNIISDISGGKKLSLFSFIKFLKDWVYSHIVIMDKSYFDHIRRITALKTDVNHNFSGTDSKTAASA